MERRVDALQHTLTDISARVDKFAERQDVRTAWERQVEVRNAKQDATITARLTQIEEDLREFRSLFKWAAMIVAGSVLAATAKFILDGGLNIVAGS